MSIPVGSPLLSRSMTPPGGSLLSFVKPAARNAARLRRARSYKRRMNTGVSGAASLISLRVGMRFSANWYSLKPPTTRTHWGAGVRQACSLSIFMASESDGTPSQRSSML
jgi:hypothetical protein